jgi:hypothetical protein
MRDFEIRIQYDDVSRQLNENFAFRQITLSPDPEKPISEEEYTEIMKILNWAKSDIQCHLSNLRRENLKISQDIDELTKNPAV